MLKSCLLKIIFCVVGYDDATPVASDSEQRSRSAASRTDRSAMAGVGGEQMQELTQLKHWLTDAQREHSGTVDVSDQKSVKDSLRKEHVSRFLLSKNVCTENMFYSIDKLILF